MATKSSGASPDKRRKSDEAFKAQALRLASESRSIQAAARQSGISSKLLYRWQPAPTAPNGVWVGDITYRPYRVRPRQDGGWLYLAVWLARCSRKVVG